MAKKSSTKKPALRAYVVTRKNADDKGYWTPIGAAWKHDSGEGYTVRLNAVPLTGEIVLLPPKDDDQAE